ncbi:MAG: M23 family metallopeptidase, partial [Oscillospiraceae bacterium]|nr:M23 family metallopeptidase [Oscillospiraceae bacterium]
KRVQQTKVFSAEEKAILKLVICGAIFVFLVMMKLLFPQTVEQMAQTVSHWIGSDANFEEAFAAVGRAVSGKETVENSLQDAYAAVFHPSDPESDMEKTGYIPQELTTRTDLSGHRVFLETIELLPQPTVVPMREISLEEVAQETVQTISYSYTIPSLPENASLEQRRLPFCYTTPVQGVLSSAFGWREHPITGETRFHYGIDLAGNTGTEIFAFADGTVYATGESSSLGKYIILSHDGGYRTLYAHCSEILKLSGHVSMGEVIAKVGESGAATGPHLHFELQDGTLYLNPIYYVALG